MVTFFRWLNRAYDERSDWLPYLDLEPGSARCVQTHGSRPGGSLHRLWAGGRSACSRKPMSSSVKLRRSTPVPGGTAQHRSDTDLPGTPGRGTAGYPRGTAWVANLDVGCQCRMGPPLPWPKGRSRAFDVQGSPQVPALVPHM